MEQCIGALVERDDLVVVVLIGAVIWIIKTPKSEVIKPNVITGESVSVNIEDPLVSVIVALKNGEICYAVSNLLTTDLTYVTPKASSEPNDGI